MASNSFGNIFRMTTWGESHGKAIGVVIDGCPAGLEISEEDIYQELFLRMPGRTEYVSPRQEKDWPEILSGVFEGKTTGAPISIVISNQDADSRQYEPFKHQLRPGHANFTYLEKYGVFDYRGGGRASARETACRVAAGAVAKKLLSHYSIEIAAYLTNVGGIEAQVAFSDMTTLQQQIGKNPLFCPDGAATLQMIEQLERARFQRDSVGGIVSFVVQGLPAGIGDPIYEKLEANLAKAMLSLPASKGFEIGRGFEVTTMNGSQHNDLFIIKEDRTETRTNHAGGTLGGISTGMPLEGRVAFKPTASIRVPQETVTQHGETALLMLPQDSRHDPCVAIRAVPVVKAMCALVIADALLMSKSSRL